MSCTDVRATYGIIDGVIDRIKWSISFIDAQWQRTREWGGQIERLLYGLPPYLKSLDNLQTKHIRRMQEADEDDVRDGGEQPGFDVDILWTPSTADSLLTDGELKLKWPSIQYF